MERRYEFGYQSRKQKLALIGLKLLVASLIGYALYRLAWQETPMILEEKLSNIAGVLIGFWVYSNLCRVKVEVQELVVSPFDNLHMAESMLVGFVLTIAHQALIIADIFRLNNWL